MPKVNTKEITNTQQTTSQSETKEKNKIFLYIGIALLLAVSGILIFLAVKNNIKLGSEISEQEQELVEVVSEEYEVQNDEGNNEASIIEKSTQEGVDETLENANMVAEKFPKDIPLPGGIVVSSSYGGNSTEVYIETNSSVKEIMDWYVNALESEGWKITAKTSEEQKEGNVKAVIEFAKTSEEKERKGQVLIETNPSIQVTMVTVKEILN
jgi:hypothetical protein